MAYGIKYNFNFSNELDELYYLTFDFLNYTGGQQNINVAVDSFVITMKNVKENHFISWDTID